VTEELSIEIKSKSLVVAEINKMVRARIALKYDLYEEIKAIRTAPTADYDAYNAYVEECRAIGRAEKTALGLI
jgi:hypothetical protein